MKLRIGNRVVEVDRFENGVPIIKADSEEIHHAGGRIDVIIKVPCLSIQSKTN